MYKRNISEVLLDGAKKHAILVISGPEGSGKTTLVKHLFKEYAYLSLHDLDFMIFAQNDPDAFFQDVCDGKKVVIDDIDLVPGLISKIDARSWDKEKLILISSRQVPELKSVKQYTLLPFSVQELQKADLLPDQLKDLIYQGFYPAIFDKKVDRLDWYTNYVQMIVAEITRDIGDRVLLDVFHHFFRLVAGRMGILLDYNSLADDCGISEETVYSWIQLLESYYIIFLLHPSTKDYGKRLVKKPKLYFYDTGLAAHLLGIQDVRFTRHYLREKFFESYVISELLKSYYNQGEIPHIECWQGITGREIDVLIEEKQQLFPIEIKQGRALSPLFFKGLNFWNALTKGDPKHGFVVYEGPRNQTWSLGHIVGWNQVAEIKQMIDKMH